MKKVISLVTGLILITSVAGNGLLAQSQALPQANFIIFPTVGEATTAFAFDASDSTNGSGENSGLQYRWKFKTNQDWTAFSGSSKTTFVPMDSGSFRAILQIKDSTTGHTKTTYRSYKARTHFDRRANIYAEPLNPKAGESVRFWIDVFKIRHEDTDDIKVRWDFDGNGVWDTNFSAHKEAWHTFGFNQIQRISPQAEVQYNDGTTIKVNGLQSKKNNTGYRSPTREKQKTKIKVSSPSVVAPILEVSPGSTGSHPDTQFIFDITKSKLPRGGWVEWSFDNDAFQKGPTRIRKQFDTPGKHVVQARTCKGISSSECAVSTASFTVKEPKTSFWVEAAAQKSNSEGTLTKVSKNYYQGFIGQKIILRATTKTAGNTSLNTIRYIWDFDGDGQWDSNSTAQSQQTYTFRKTGRFYPTVEAVSEQGVKAQATLVIDIAPNTAPKGSLKLSANTINAGQTITIAPTLQDKENPYNDLEVRYDANGDGKWDGGFTSPRSIQWQYNTPGKYLIRMQVKDPYNQTHISQAALMVNQDPLLIGRARTKKCGSCVSNSTKNKSINDSEEWAYNPNKNDNDSTSSEEKQNTNKNEDEFFTGNDNENNGPSNKNSSTGGGSSNNRYQNNRVGQHELRIPINPPVLDIHKDFKEYIEYATGWDNSYSGAQAIEPFISDTSYGNPLNGNASESTTQETSNNSLSESNAPSGSENESSQNQKTDTSSQDKSSAFVQSLSSKYANTAIQPPYPGENPFVDVSSSDWYYEIAVQSYRDGLTTGKYFFQ